MARQETLGSPRKSRTGRREGSRAFPQNCGRRARAGKLDSIPRSLRSLRDTKVFRGRPNLPIDYMILG